MRIDLVQLVGGAAAETQHVISGHADAPMDVTGRASLRSLMTRMGHDSMRAALIYRHTGQRDDAAIATALSKQIQQHRACRGHAGKNRKKK